MTTAPRLRKPARPAGLLIAIGACWLALAVAHVIVPPLIGAFTLRTWLLIGACTLAIVALTGFAALWALVRRWPWRWTAALCALALLTVATMFHVERLHLTPEGQYRMHQASLAQLAEDYQAGLIAGRGDLPWRLRALSRDRGGIERCWCPDAECHEQVCRLTLTAYWNWRGTNGWAFVYYPEGRDYPPGLGERELGDGWWWVRVAV